MRNKPKIKSVGIPKPFLVHEPIEEPLPPVVGPGRRTKEDPMIPVLEKVKQSGLGKWFRLAEHPNASAYVYKMNKKYKDFEFACRSTGEGDAKVFCLYCQYIGEPVIAQLPPIPTVKPPFLAEE